MCVGYVFASQNASSLHRDHYDDFIMDVIASQITSLTIVYSTVYSDAYQRKHQSSASLAFVWGIHRGIVEFPTQMAPKMFPFDDVIMWGNNGSDVLNMKNCIFFLISKIIVPEVSTLLYPIQSERLAVIYWNLYMVLKCSIEKWIGVSDLYYFTCCSVDRHTCKTVFIQSECL